MKRFIIISLLLTLAASLFAQGKIEIMQVVPGQPPQNNQPGAKIKVIMPKQMKASPKADEQLAADRIQRVELRGDYEKALQGWQDLLTKYPWNVDAINGSIRCYTVLKRYDDANNFIDQTIKRGEFREPKPILEDLTSKFSLSLQKGQVAYLKGDGDKAWEIWNGAMNEQGKSPNAVRALGTMLQNQRLWDDCAKLIRDYRKQSKDPGFMSMELANSMRAQMDFSGATEELIGFARTTPAGWSIATNFIERFPDDSTVVGKVSVVIQKALKTERDNPDLWKIYAGYMLKVGELEKSLDATITADSLNDKNGSLTLQAAQNMLKEGEVGLARRAFERVIKWKAGEDIGQRAELGLGECLEAQGQWLEAKQAYYRFIGQHGSAKSADDAKFKIAEILLNRENKADSALVYYKGLWIRGLNSPLAQRALVGLRVGDCNAYLGRYDDAISAWQEIVKLTPQQQQQLQASEEPSQAMLRIARANFWRDSTNAALDQLDQITAGNVISPAFNDAILYTALFEAGGVREAVRAFADGDRQIFMNQFLSAAENFSKAADMIKSGKIAEWARYQEALAFRQARKPSEAIAALDTFITRYPESSDLDRAVYTRAMIQADDLKNESAASEAFQKFLLDYPRSNYLEQARRKARILANRIS